MKDPTFIIIPILLLALIGYFSVLFRYERLKKQRDNCQHDLKESCQQDDSRDENKPNSKFSLIPIAITLFGVFLLMASLLAFLYGSPSHEFGAGASLLGLAILFIVGGLKLF
jgi:Ca2+/H+ antiporter